MPATLTCTTGTLPVPSCVYVTPTVTVSETATCSCVHGRCVKCCPWSCACDADPVLGYWAGTNCDDCAPGWWGTQCAFSCPGGPCSPCNEHGTCDQGVTGTGACTCDQDPTRGYWQGNACNECSEGWTGPRCTIRCQSCSGNGRCSATGACECKVGFSQATNCASCVAGRVLSSEVCVSACPGETAKGAECSGFGTCKGAACACAAGYWGSDCSNVCACGQGTCDTQTGACTCNKNFQPPLCTSCIDGFWGDACEKPCPCSGNGWCDKEGTCFCKPEFTGPRCDARCPGVFAPCGGRGKCGYEAGRAVCTCDKSAVSGHFAGDDCSLCAENWWGSSCTITCNNGAGCGPGVCYHNGKCGCPRGVPGSADLCGATCEKTSCDYCSGYATWGRNCVFRCPGLPACSGHGYCDAAETGTGECWCEEGWVGTSCENECPVSFGKPCGGPSRGMCMPSGTCDCVTGWGGKSCEVTCPLFNEQVCGGRGTCKDDPPKCACADGFGGDSCGFECSCGTYSVCDSSAGCRCSGNYALNATGMCEVCKSGWAGERCDVKCVNGAASRTTLGLCECNAGYSGVGCDHACPLGASGARCAGKGVCKSGAGLERSVCECSAGWYGASCEVRCQEGKCRDQGFKYPQCEPDGSCGCQDNVQGHYAGEQCDRCKDQWYVMCVCVFVVVNATHTFHAHRWGLDCDAPCECSGHGSCDVNTGMCTCYGNKEAGFWQGARCEQCEDGFIGEVCLIFDVSRVVFCLKTQIRTVSHTIISICRSARRRKAPRPAWSSPAPANRQSRSAVRTSS